MTSTPLLPHRVSAKPSVTAMTSLFLVIKDGSKAQDYLRNHKLLFYPASPERAQLYPQRISVVQEFFDAEDHLITLTGHPQLLYCLFAIIALHPGFRDGFHHQTHK